LTAGPRANFRDRGPIGLATCGRSGDTAADPERAAHEELSPMFSDDRDALAAALGAVALAAGAAVMDIYDRGPQARLKADRSPVTDADEAAERVILARLAYVMPDACVISEEAVSRGERPAPGAVVALVDPLDGTREFLARNGEFAVNIGVVRDGAPICGAIYAPAQGRLWFGGASAFVVDAPPGAALPERSKWRPARTRDVPAGGAVALVSRTHPDAAAIAMLDRLGVAERRPMGSSIKFCAVADGSADVYPRFGPTMLWDVAAGDAVLRAAGGAVLGTDGRPMRYNCAGDLKNGGFVAWGRPPAPPR
jgi:3'(2'), 5'-bisphosphate nucleotidase